LGADLRNVWQAPTTTARDKKELLRALLEEVIIAVNKEDYRSHLTLRWRGGALAEIDLDLPRRRVAAPVRTDEDTVALMRRLAVHYPDAVIAGILNRQQRTTAYGHRFTANHVRDLRHVTNSRAPCSGRPIATGGAFVRTRLRRAGGSCQKQARPLQWAASLSPNLHFSFQLESGSLRSLVPR
jgi:hypothetical protein